VSLVADGDRDLAKLLTNCIALIGTGRPTLPRFHLSPTSLVNLDNVIGHRRKKEETFDEFQPLSSKEIKKLYSEAGPLAFNGSKFLLVEAGTGVGKSFAYLSPAILWAYQNQEKIIISTNTKNLQEQLFFKDLPLLKEVMGIPFKAVLLKGRNNYLCLYKLHLMISEGERQLPAPQRLKLMPVVLWADGTTSGDLNECTAISGKDSWLLTRVSCEGSFCLFKNCPHYQKCFLWKVRTNANKADLVVVNHHLFFSDLKADNTLGEELSFWQVKRIMGSLYEKHKLESGLLPFLIQKVNFSPLKNVEKLSFEEKTDRAIEKTNLVLKSFEELFRKLYRLLSRDIDGKIQYSLKKRYEAKGKFVRSLKEEGLQALKDLESLTTSLHRLVQSFQEYSSDRFEGAFELGQLLDAKIVELKNLTATCRHLLFADEREGPASAGKEDFVHWAEFPPQAKESDLSLVSAPIEIGRRMNELVYGRIKTGIFTSATLASGGDFSFMVSRLGLDLLEPDKLLVLEVGSPFDYPGQVHLSVPKSLPSPKGESFQEKVSELVKNLCLTCQRNSLVLFTSYSMLNFTYKRIREHLEEAGFSVLAQGVSGNAASILKRLKGEGKTVLFQVILSRRRL